MIFIASIRHLYSTIILCVRYLSIKCCFNIFGLNIRRVRLCKQLSCLDYALFSYVKELRCSSWGNVSSNMIDYLAGCQLDETGSSLVTTNKLQLFLWICMWCWLLKCNLLEMKPYKSHCFKRTSVIEKCLNLRAFKWFEHNFTTWNNPHIFISR